MQLILFPSLRHALRHAPDPWLSDTSESGSVDFSGDTTGGDWTGGTGDSGVVLPHTPLSPPPVPPKHTGPRYEKLQVGKKDPEHQYSRVNEPRYISVKLPPVQSSSSKVVPPPPVPIKRSSQPALAEKGKYENLPTTASRKQVM